MTVAVVAAAVTKAAPAIAAVEVIEAAEAVASMACGRRMARRTGAGRGEL